MQKFFFPILLVILFTACNSNPGVVPSIEVDEFDSLSDAYEYTIDDDDEPEEVQGMRIDSAGPLASLIGFPTEWERIEDMDGIAVLPEPCNGSNQAFSIVQEESGELTLVYYFGEQDLRYNILACEMQIAQDANEYVFTIVPTFTETQSEQVMLTATYNNGKQGLWKFAESDTGVECAPLEKTAYFPIIKESCLVCWEDPCGWEKDWIDGFGIGVVTYNVIAGDKIEFFSQPDLTSTSNSFEMTKEILGGMASAPEWFAPMVYHPEYDLMHMVCKERDDGWYKVVPDERTGEAFWIQMDKRLSFLHWDAYVSTALTISRLEQLRNPLRPLPGFTGELITYEYEYDCFVPLRVVGNWVEVEFGDFCDEEAPFERAWFMWRDLQGTVIDFAWVM
jgi:hypothetical protein